MSRGSGKQRCGRPPSPSVRTPRAAAADGRWASTTPPCSRFAACLHAVDGWAWCVVCENRVWRAGVVLECVRARGAVAMAIGCVTCRMWHGGCRVVQECCLVAYVARAVCVRWTYYGVSRLARGDGMLWVAGGQQRGPRRARACMCVPRSCELSVSVTSQSCMRGACHGCTL